MVCNSYFLKLSYSIIVLYIRSHEGSGFSGQKYHPETSFTITSCCLGSVGQAQKVSSVQSKMLPKKLLILFSGILYLLIA